MSRIVYLLGVICMLVVLTAVYQTPGDQFVNETGEFVSNRSSTDHRGSNDKIAKVAKSCFRCHSAPIHELYTDTAWINAIPETTWMTMGAEVRAALQTYVRSNDIADCQPILVRPEQTPQSASLDVGFDDGSVLLRRDDNRYRVVYAKDDHSAPELSPGEYKILGFKIRRQAEDGEQWFISTCGIRNETIDIKQKPTSHKIDPTIYFDVETKKKGNSVNVQLSIKSKLGSSITIYRDEHRVPANFKMCAADGELVAQGSMQYGWGSGATASVKLADKVHMPLTVNVQIDHGPFSAKGDLEKTID